VERLSRFVDKIFLGAGGFLAAGVLCAVIFMVVYFFVTVLFLSDGCPYYGCG
jgi:hypothetical protein